MNLRRLTFILVNITACVNILLAKDTERVWYWFAKCGGPAMTLEVKLDGTTISKTTFPICHALRDSLTSNNGNEQKRIEFPFRSKRTIVWTGYRDESDETKADELVEGSIWQAGADPDCLIIGVSFFSGDKILMNTLHIAYPEKRESSEIASGLVISTYPARQGNKNPAIR